MPPFTRKVLVLVGATGLEREALVKKIVNQNQKLFDTIKAGKMLQIQKI